MTPRLTVLSSWYFRGCRLFVRECGAVLAVKGRDGVGKCGERSGKHGSPRASLDSQLLNALWHGCYPFVIRFQTPIWIINPTLLRQIDCIAVRYSSVVDYHLRSVVFVVCGYFRCVTRA